MSIANRNRLAAITALVLLASVFAFSANAAPPSRPPRQSKPSLTFDAFFHAVDIAAVRMAPDGKAIVIETERPDYAHNRFRSDLWMYRISTGQLTPFETSGYASNPQWSPDSRWIAFTSGIAKHGSQIYVISASGGGEDLLTYAGEGGVHSYAWAPDSKTIYYSAKVPVSEAEKKQHEKIWKDVIRYRRDLRADNIYEVKVPSETNFSSTPPKKSREGTLVAHTARWVEQMLVTRDGKTIVFVSCSRRGPIFITGNDGYKSHQVFTVDLAAPSHSVHQLMNIKTVAGNLQLAPDGKGIYFEAGSDPDRYADLSGRIFYEPLTGGTPTRFAAGYTGSFAGYAITPDGDLISAGQFHMNVPIYQVTQQAQTELPSRPGEYQNLSMAKTGSRLAFVYSTLTSPSEVYLASDWQHPNQAVQITHFNASLAARDLPRGHSFWWTADDGVRVEGMLIFPPGKYDAKHLPMFMLIHGGPEDADVNHWEADWYQWASLAASQGWLVFEPNYRGSSGYGDAFMNRIVPHIVSRPGKDILEGVQAVIRAGYADPNHMAIGGYSYGGYMTDWLITQTTEFKAAVTGAGAIENTANWGNDDLSYDDTYYLGGLPWQNEKAYNEQAAIWQMAKVKTPTQIVMGTADQRVSTCEDFLLDRALRAVGVPTEMLMFPGEHHGLGNDPWHGRIKVREELKWLRHWTKADVAPVKESHPES